MLKSYQFVPSSFECCRPIYHLGDPNRYRKMCDTAPELSQEKNSLTLPIMGTVNHKNIMQDSKIYEKF